MCVGVVVEKICKRVCSFVCIYRQMQESFHRGTKKIPGEEKFGKSRRCEASSI